MERTKTQCGRGPDRTEFLLRVAPSSTMRMAFRLSRPRSQCASLAVPRSAVPADGWPTVVYAHGTGGFFSSMFFDGTAARLRSGYAVLGFDNVMHGPGQAGRQ